MADMPDTDNVQVAIITAALAIAEKSVTAHTSGFPSRLRYFLTAYKAISSAVETSPSEIDIKALVEQIQQDINKAS